MMLLGLGDLLLKLGRDVDILVPCNGQHVAQGVVHGNLIGFGRGATPHVDTGLTVELQGRVFIQWTIWINNIHILLLGILLSRHVDQ